MCIICYYILYYIYKSYYFSERYVRYVFSCRIREGNYHGSSAAIAGLLKILAALNLLFVGIGSPAGV
jgi:hypothetical protein